MNNKETVHPSDDLIDDEYSNIEDHENRHEQTNWNDSFYTLVDNEIQSRPQLEDPNETNDWKTTDNYQGELFMDYDTNTGNNTLRPRTFYVLYIGPNDNSIGHLIFKLSTKQISITINYQSVPVPDDLIEAINKIDSINNKIQIDHFGSDLCTT